MAMIITITNLLERIRKKYQKKIEKIRYWCLIRIKDNSFEKEVSLFSPKELISFLEKAEKIGLDVIGGRTDRHNELKPVKGIKERVERFLKAGQAVGFVNLYEIFFETDSGIILVEPWGYIFVEGVSHPADSIPFHLFLHPNEVLQRIKEETQKLKLTVFNIDPLVIVRIERVKEDGLEKFKKDLDTLLDKINDIYTTRI